MTAAPLLVALAFYVAALDLAWGWGFIQSVASAPGLLLLAGAGALLAASALRAARAPGSVAVRSTRTLLRAGTALTILALAASLLLRSGGGLSAGEGQAIPASEDYPALQFGEVSLAPHGPHVLSKTVEVEVLAEGRGEEPVRIGLFPPTHLAGHRFTVLRFGYAPGFTLLKPDGARIADGRVKLGTLPQTQEAASLVAWTPETNVMMGAGTFPPRLEDLVTPTGSDLHVFLRIVEATLGGVRRDLADPEAYRWLLDGRPADVVFLVQVFRGRERVFDGRVRAGQEVTFAGGALALAPDVLLWVDVLATSNPALPAVAVGLVLLAAGSLLAARCTSRGAPLRGSRGLPTAAGPHIGNSPEASSGVRRPVLGRAGRPAPDSNRTNWAVLPISIGRRLRDIPSRKEQRT